MFRHDVGEIVQPILRTRFTVKCTITNLICQWTQKGCSPSARTKSLFKLLQIGFNNFSSVRFGIVKNQNYFIIYWVFYDGQPYLLDAKRLYTDLC